MGSIASIHVGTCAWSHDDWRGVFYPEHLPAADRLSFYSRHLSSVEVDSTFYHSPAPQVAAHWEEVTPPGFLFSLKLPRTITHENGLRDSEEELASFLRDVAPLRRKLGCVLIQLPPYFTRPKHQGALRDFIRHLPRTGVRFAVEFRDAEWHLPRISHLLEEHGVCWVWNDVSPLPKSAAAPFGFWPRTADFVYLRLLGDLTTKYTADGATVHRYRGLEWPRDAAMEGWAEKVRAHVGEVKHVYIYANNHFEGFGPKTAQRIAEQLGLTVALPGPEEMKPQDERQLPLL